MTQADFVEGNRLERMVPEMSERLGQVVSRSVMPPEQVRLRLYRGIGYVAAGSKFHAEREML